MVRFSSVTVLVGALLGVVSSMEFLKSNGDIRVVEGDDLVLTWTAYNEADRNQPCSWSYAPDKTSEEDVFLVWENSKRYEFGQRSPFQFTRTQEPCKGGIRKPAKMADSGVYRMKLMQGYILGTPDTQTLVTVYNPSNLKYEVAVNGTVYNFDLSKGPELFLKPLVTHKPIQVSVSLSQVFPPSTVTIAGEARDIPCTNPYDKCSGTILLGAEEASNDIIITITTGIIGANTVTITQPVTYSVPEDNSSKNAAIAFGILFFIVLGVLIAIIVRIILLRRKSRKNAKKDVEAVKSPEVEKDEKKTSMLDRVKKSAQSTASDLVSALIPSKSLESQQLNKMKEYIEEEKKTVAQLRQQANYDEKLLEVQSRDYDSKEKGVLISIDDVMRRCDRLSEKMRYQRSDMEIKKKSEDGLTEKEHSQYMMLKQLLSQCGCLNDDLTWLKADIERAHKSVEDYRDGLSTAKDAQIKSLSSPAPPEENANTAHSDNELNDSRADASEPQENDKLNPRKLPDERYGCDELKQIHDLHQQHQATKCLIETMDFIKLDLSRQLEALQVKESRIHTISDDIHNMEQIYSGFKMSLGSPKTSPITPSPDPTPAHAAAMTDVIASQAPPADVEQPSTSKSKRFSFKGVLPKSKRKSTDGGGDK